MTAQLVPVMDHEMSLASPVDARASTLATNVHFKPGVFFMRRTGGHVAATAPTPASAMCFKPGLVFGH
jgi:hypothetical protein